MCTGLRAGGLLSLRLQKTVEEEDRTRLLAAAAGDAGEQAWLVDHYSQQVYRFCLRMLRDEQDALDATQDSMIKVLRNLARYDPERRFTTWVFGIARNTCIDVLRRRGRTTEMPDREFADPAPSPMELTERELRASRLLAALDKLRPDYREVLVLYHFEHLKYREIADTLNQPPGTIMNRIFRARNALREIYATLEQGENP